MNKACILIVDDEELIRLSLRHVLIKAGYQVLEADSPKKTLSLLGEKDFVDLIILDLVLPGVKGFEFLKKLREEYSHIPIIVITAFSTISTAVESIKLGAYDYMPKPFNVDEVTIKVTRAIENMGINRELKSFKVMQESRLKNNLILYKSEAMEEVMEKVKKISSLNIENILITGETGTGKDLTAKTIHLFSNRFDKPFIPINCIAIPSTLLESELFGYEKGAFTNATQLKKGLIEEANEGTLFLDEIGDMDISLQGKLLRFVEERTLRRLGGKKDIKVDVLLIASTNKDFTRAIDSGTFRRDLFHRLSHVNIHLPPLREREVDIPFLANYFLEKYCRKYGRKTRGYTEKALETLSKYSWPGNVRELKNLVEEIMIYEDSLEIITDEILIKKYLRKAYSTETKTIFDSISFDSLFFQNEDRFEDIIKEISKKMIKKALELSNNNKTKAAKILKMDRSTLNYQIKNLGILY